jgi:Ca2+-binding EF-hand superfamily protein
MTIEELRGKIRTNLSYEIINQDGNKVIDNTELVGTGYEVELKTGIIYKIVVKGDTNGDGEADFKDMVRINSHRLNKKHLEEVYLLAGDVKEDGLVDFKDMIKINKFRLHKILEL